MLIVVNHVSKKARIVAGNAEIACAKVVNHVAKNAEIVVNRVSKYVAKNVKFVAADHCWRNYLKK